MTKFEEELKNNNLVCSECTKCKKLVWPPNDFCNKCLNEVVWRPLSRNAKLVEHSMTGGKRFGIAEFEEGIRIFGTIEGNSRLQIGQDIILRTCDFDEMPKFIFEPASN